MPRLPATAVGRSSSTKSAFSVRRATATNLESRESGIRKHHPAIGTWVNTPLGTGFVSEISMRQGKEFSEVTLVGHGSVQVCSDEIDGKQLLPNQCTYAGQLVAYLCAPSMVFAGHSVKHTSKVQSVVACPKEEEAKMRRRRYSKELQRGSSTPDVGVDTSNSKSSKPPKLRRAQTTL